MLRRKNLLLLLLGGALFLAFLQLAPDRKSSNLLLPPPASSSQVTAQPAPSSVASSGLSKPAATALEAKQPARTEIAVEPKTVLAAANTSTKKPPRPVVINVRQVGVVTSTSISIVRAVGPAKIPGPLQQPQSHHQSLPRMLKMFGIALSHYAPVPPQKVQRVIIVTYFRAGSTFVGDILSSSPRTFYHFEPLHMFSKDARLEPEPAKNASDLVGHLLRCEFTRAQHYIRWVSANKFLFRRNHFLWALCGGQTAVCFKADYVAKVCARAPVQVMKITRLHMSQVQDWIAANGDIANSVKVVHLVRDPRGILASRRLLDWCNESKSCAHQDTLCSEIRADLDSFEILKRQFPNATYRLRYEDISVDPEKETVALFKALGLSYTTSVSNFLKTHTRARKADALDPYSTRRNSSTVAFEWRKKLAYEDIADIQRACADVLLRLGYKTIDSKKELYGKPPMRPIPNLITTGTRIAMKVSQDKAR